jgi:hypothetical protein
MFGIEGARSGRRPVEAQSGRSERSITGFPPYMQL